VWNEEVVNELYVTAKSLVEMLNNSLDMAKLEEGRTEFNKSFEHIGKLLDTVISINNAKAKNKGTGVRLSPIYSNLLPDLVEVDRARLTQIVMNMVSNAIKFTPEGGKVEVRARWLWNCGRGMTGGDCTTCEAGLKSKECTPAAAGEEKADGFGKALHSIAEGGGGLIA
jgi:signal transduction histidine kinase